MKGLSRIAVRFLLIATATLVVLTVLWTWIAPGVDWATAELAAPLFRLVESPNLTSVEVRGAQIWVLRDVPGTGAVPFTWFDRYLSWSLVPLVALLCATPGLGIRRRFIRLAIGIGLFLAVQALYLVVSVELAYSVVIYGRSLSALQTLVRILWEATPILLWIALSAGAWRTLWSETGPEKRKQSRLSRREDRTAEA
jgi:hypothetical protein